MSSTNPKIKLSRVLSELKQDYLEKLPHKIEILKELTRQRNWEELENAYHKLKGTGKTYGFPEISVICQKLEDLAGRGAEQDVKVFEDSLTLLERVHQSYVNSTPLDLNQDSFARSLLALPVK